MANDDTDLSFDRATYETKGEVAGASGPTCPSCNGPLGDSYWKWQQVVVCVNCRPGLEVALAKSQTAAAFGKAAALGAGTALGLGAAYAIFTHLLHSSLAIITIGIAYAIAKVIRKASGGVSGLRYQILASLLAYVAGTMSYLGYVFSPSQSYALSDIVVGIGVMLAAPILTITKSPFGALIVGIGVWQAWTLTRPIPLTIEGPFRIGQPAASTTV